MLRYLTTAEKRQLVLRRLAADESLRAICSHDGMPSAATVCGWAQRDPAFAKQYAAARGRAGQ